MLCTACNWHPHDVSVHGETCRHGHPIAIVGRYKDGHCKACQRAAQRKHDAAHRERNRARWRRWWVRTHAPSEATPEGANDGGRSVAGLGAARVAPTCPTCMGLGCNDCCHTGR